MSGALDSRAAGPTLGAVVLNYNYAEYLPEAIDGLLGQTHQFDEIVVVNDGSTDDSMAVLARYLGKVTVLDIPNGGQLGACLAGLAATTSDYVYFLDADDHVRSDLVAALQEPMSRGPVKVQFQLEAVSAGVDLHGSVFPSYPDGYDTARMRDDNRALGLYICPPTSGNVYRRETLAGLPLDTLDQRDFIDGPATMALPYLGAIETVNRPLAYYRLHGRNHSQHRDPSTRQLSEEIAWFHRRWAQVCRLIGSERPPFADGPTPLQVRERELMIAALDNRAATVRLAIGFIAGLLRSNVPPRRKAMLIGWSLALVVPVAAARTALVRLRLSPVSRSGRARQLVAVLARGPLRPRRRAR